MTISSEERRLTPIEIAQARLDQVQADISRLEREQHQLAGLRDAARRASNEAEHERIADLFKENNIALRTATGGRLPDARQALVQAQEQLRRARSRASETTNAIKRLDIDLQTQAARLQSLGAERLVAQAAYDRAQAALLALEPPAPPTATPEPPAPAVEVAAPTPRKYPAPARTVYGIGFANRYYDAAGLETDSNGQPLDVQPEPPTPRKPDPNAAQSAPSLY